MTRYANQMRPVDASADWRARPYYVYLYRDARPGRERTPLYVGKGRDTESKGGQARARRHWNQTSCNPILGSIFADMRRIGVVPTLELAARFETEDEALGFEIDLISRLGRRDQGSGSLCNLTDGGEGRVGSSPSEKTRHLLSEASRRSHANPDIRRRISEASKQMHADPDFRARRASRLKEALSSPAWKAGQSARQKEIHAREHERDKRIASIRTAWRRPEARKRKSEASLRRYADPEERVRQSHRQLEVQNRPETKARKAEGLRAYYAMNPDARRQRAAALRAYHCARRAAEGVP